jgi:hypothetical protein
MIISLVVLTGKSLLALVKNEGEKVYQNAKEDVIRRREQNESKQRAESAKTKRVDKVVSGVSFNTTIEKDTSDIKEVSTV